MDRRRKVLASALALAPVLLACAFFLTRFELAYVHGGSMEPTVSSGDIVIVDEKRPATRGAILLFGEPGHPKVLHRAVRRRGGAWVTKGDANPVVDLAAARDEWISGPVVAVVPLGTGLERWRPSASCATLSAQPKSNRR